MAIPYAKDSDIDIYDKSIREMGVESFENHLTLASNDILNLIKGVWWPSATSLPLTSFDEANLNEGALLQLTVFKALGDYSYPSIAKFTETDTLVAKAEHFKERFKEEWATIKGLALYDFDESSTFDDDEKPGPFVHRLSRG